MSAKYYVPVPFFHYWPKLTHSAARSLRDSWATCILLLHCYCTAAADVFICLFIHY